MGDGEAFEAFLADEMPRICRVQNYNIAFRGQMHRIEQVFYKWLRCDLAHAGKLPSDITFSVSNNPNAITTTLENDMLILTDGWLWGILASVVKAPENADEFKGFSLVINPPSNQG